MKNVSIVSGFVRGDRAIVFFDGSSTTIERLRGKDAAGGSSSTDNRYGIDTCRI